jgi:pimeloyl-ACP methyl ester carboxylesterase
MALHLNYREYAGPGPVLLLLHGLFGRAANWGAIAKHLAKDYTVIVPDLRNHGASPHDADMRYESMTADVISLLNRLGINEAIWVGHSMGGKVAMTAALKDPSRVRALAVVDMAPVSYTHNFDDVLAGFDAVDLSVVQSRKEADLQMSQVISSAALRGFLLQNLQRDEQGYRWELGLEHLRAAVSSITGFEQPQSQFEDDAVFIPGSDSHYVTEQNWPIIQQHFPRASRCVVEGAGHWVYADKPQEFMRCLQQFLQSLDD